MGNEHTHSKIMAAILLVCCLLLCPFLTQAQNERLSVEQSDSPEQNQIPKKTILALKTNLLLPLANVGVAVPCGENWSVGANYYYPWVPRNRHHKECWQALGWELEGRYWFGRERVQANRLLGHSIGISAMAGYYDLEQDYSGHQGEFINGSLDYTFAKQIFKKKMHLEFTIGLGYFFSKALEYEVFEDGGKGYKKGYKKNVTWVGPNKIGIQLVVPIKAGGKKK